ncbi:DUF2242 domain-containing protein [Luteimonas sp. A482]
MRCSSPPRRSIALVAVAVLALAACGSNGLRSQAPPLGEVFGAEDTYARSYPVAPDVACEATRRALLGQGYIIKLMAPEALEASKHFQPESDIHTQLNVRATCVPQVDGGAIVFINAVQERYALQGQSSSASLGVSMIGSFSVPVPIGGGNANLVRVGSNTVQNQEFYTRLFDRVGFYLPGTPSALPAPPPEPEAPPDPVLLDQY